LKLLYIVHQFFPLHYTGTERLTLDIAKQMQRMGHEPTVVTYEPSNAEGFATLTDSISASRYLYEGIPVIALKSNYALDGAEIFSAKIKKAASKLALKFDLIHVFHPMWLSSLVKAYSEDSATVMLTLTDTWLLCPSGLIDTGFRICNGPVAEGGCSSCPIGSRVHARFKQARVVYDMAKELTSASRFIQTIFQENGLSRTMRIIPHGIDYRYVSRKPRQDSRNVVLGFIGTLAWHKGAHVLISAARKVRNPTLLVKIYGSIKDQPDYSWSLMDLAAGDERVRFLGSFGIERMPEIMSDLSALVIPSTYYENYPLVALSALAHKVPVIASRIGGMPEIIQDGHNGFLFEAGSYEELAAVINRILDDPKILEKVRENITDPRRVEEEAMDYENIYRELLKK